MADPSSILPLTNAPHRVETATSSLVKTKEDEVSREFEAVFLGHFVDEMMKTVDDGAFGGDKQAEMWRSFLSNAVAEQLAEQGTLGVSASIKHVLSAYNQSQNGTK